MQATDAGSSAHFESKICRAASLADTELGHPVLRNQIINTFTTMLNYARLHYARLCCAMLCYATLCYGMLIKFMLHLDDGFLKNKVLLN